MMVRKLRLERGWSQEQLAQMSGLNPRTIQRIERGQTPGLESLKSLAAVFEIDIFQLTSESQQELPMGDTSLSTNATTTELDSVNSTMQRSKELRIQLIALFVGYILVVAMLWVSNLMTYPQYYWAVFPTVSLAFVVFYIAVTAVLPNHAGKPTLLESMFNSITGAPDAKPPINSSNNKLD